ncbi:MAG: hypothetical protein WCH86_06425 [Kiritimatiellales bacterium]
MAGKLEHFLFDLSQQGRRDACDTYRRRLGGLVFDTDIATN